MQELIDQVQAWTELLGPNVYIQAAGIALFFILLGKIADFVISRLLGKLVSHSKTNLDDNVIALLHKPVFVSFVLLGLSLAAVRLQIPATPEFLTLGILKTIAIVIWVSFFSNLIRIILNAIARREQPSEFHTSMLPLFDNVLKVTLFALAVYFIFLAWNIDVTAWLASAGIIGLALSFAAKDTLSNLFAGVSIIADTPYKKGDFIILDTGERGEVTHIGLRSTRILTRDDVEITIPNGILGNTKIINEAGGPSTKHRIRIAVGTAYGSDIDHVIKTLDDVAASHDEVCATPEPRVRFRGFGNSSLDFELLCWIDQPVDRGRMLHELNCAVYKAFQKAKIEIPFPQRDLHVRSLPAEMLERRPD